MSEIWRQVNRMKMAGTIWHVSYFCTTAKNNDTLQHVGQPHMTRQDMLKILLVEHKIQGKCTKDALTIA
jgi:hypothetical protein